MDDFEHAAVRRLRRRQDGRDWPYVHNEGESTMMNKARPAIDMDRFEQQLRPVLDRVQVSGSTETGDARIDYAPPAVRQQQLESSVVQVKSFGELPTKEIDEMIAKAKADIAKLEEKGQAVRDVYVKHTGQIMEAIKTLQETVQLGMKTLDQLNEQCTALANPAPRDQQKYLPSADE